MKDAMSFYRQNYMHTEKFQKHIQKLKKERLIARGDNESAEEIPDYHPKECWDGKERLFHARWKTFPTGLLPIARKILSLNGFTYEIQDDRKKPEPQGDSFELPHKTLRYYQREAVEAMLTHESGIVKLPTGSGKTLVAIALVKKLWLPTLYIVDKRNLLHQTRRAFINELGLPDDTDLIGMYGDGHKVLGKIVTIGISKTIHKHQNILSKFKVLIIDETHRSAANTYFKKLKKCKAYYRYGISATPLDRSDGASLKVIALTGNVIYEKKEETLVEEGYLIMPTVKMIVVKEPVLDEKDVDYNYAYDMCIVNNPIRTKLTCDWVHKAIEHGMSVLVLVEKVDHGVNIDKKLWSFKQISFITHEFVYGKHTSKEQQEALDKLEQGKLQCLIATRIFGEGTDMPSVGCIINAAGFQSTILTEQKKGRGMRPSEGKNEFWLIDFADITNPYLARHSVARRDTYESHGYEVEFVE
jgi:superfamily II DNA or RNA helicase